MPRSIDGSPGTPAKECKSRTKRYYMEYIALKTGFGQPMVKAVLEMLLDQMMDDMAEGRRIEFREFGVFEIRVRAQRRAQNPKTLEPVVVPPRRSIKFKPSRRLRETVEVAGRTPASAAPQIEFKPAKPARTPKAARTARDDEGERRSHTQRTHRTNNVPLASARPTSRKPR